MHDITAENFESCHGQAPSGGMPFASDTFLSWEELRIGYGFNFMKNEGRSEKRGNGGKKKI
jgi:hypothetical protein